MARYASTIYLSNIINFLSTKLLGDSIPDAIPKNHQIMLWWAGLRGAIAFALSVEVKGPSSMPIRTTTLVVCVFTIVLLGGTTKFMIDYLNIPVSEKIQRTSSTLEEYDSSSNSDYSDGEMDQIPEQRVSECSSTEKADDDPLFSRKALNALRGEREISNWLVKVDQKYLKPFFCIKKPWNSSRKNCKSLSDPNAAPERDLSAKFSDSTIASYM